jgi:protein-S-isoprenylcysteine O-methyltransferase Ste14
VKQKPNGTEKPNAGSITRILWRNVPIPEPFVVALAAGGVLQIAAPVPVFRTRPIRSFVAAVLMIAGASTAIWAVIEARDNDLARPTSLLTSGPYAFSRNPMYLSWAVIGLALATLLNSLWIAIAALSASAYLHMVTIPREEQALLSKFGAEYDVYRDTVRRW